MSLQLHRPDGKGGLEPRTVKEKNWRSQLRSPRWGAARRDGELPELSNTEMNPTSTGMAIAFWVGLAALTFLLLIVGFGSGFWTFPVATPIPPALPSPG